jgi:hypothetical protein
MLGYICVCVCVCETLANWHSMLMIKRKGQHMKQLNKLLLLKLMGEGGVRLCIISYLKDCDYKG